VTIARTDGTVIKDINKEELRKMRIQVEGGTKRMWKRAAYISYKRTVNVLIKSLNSSLHKSEPRSI